MNNELQRRQATLIPDSVRRRRRGSKGVQQPRGNRGATQRASGSRPNPTLAKPLYNANKGHYERSPRAADRGMGVRGCPATMEVVKSGAGEVAAGKQVL
ncbi:hypothetical protein ES703_81476 [subsurface metagenome]